ncbi:MAG: DUF87 domain-containing protein, partial [Candidatus Aenigmarchaeota archaeon]|nr:DUF87 domain-containing protein [Candidatus Aenigmarchaeota archaeon]
YSTKDNISIADIISYIKEINTTKITAPGDYLLEISVYYNGRKTDKVQSFTIVKPFWTKSRINYSIIFLLLILAAISSYYALEWYKKNKAKKARYIFPLDFKKLHQKTPDALWMGKIAETNINAYFNKNDITTHILTSGATGAGKSVAASIIVEEALKKNVAVVVFDPTAQWSGFVRPCKDNNLLKMYRQFDMKHEDAHPFSGIIFNIPDDKFEVDFDKYNNPGEITVFNLNRLTTEQYDNAVSNILTSILKRAWEESPELKMIIVFDEVHRLLSKYGGGKGYVALEKAAREFRKWGLGLVAISQVSSDFKEAVSGNILTEIQLNTKSKEDIDKIKYKYGDEFARRISRQTVGVGLMQNAKYNDGKPWFVHFRPPHHSPHKITDEMLDLYDKYSRSLEEMEAQIKAFRNQKKDVSNMEIELKLAKTKLKQARFKMCEIYIESLRKEIKRFGEGK